MGESPEQILARNTLSQDAKEVTKNQMDQKLAILRQQLNQLTKDKASV